MCRWRVLAKSIPQAPLGSSTTLHAELVETDERRPSARITRRRRAMAMAMTASSSARRSTMLRAVTLTR
jgi:hypothetical protein